MHMLAMVFRSLRLLGLSREVGIVGFVRSIRVSKLSGLLGF
jgi:hypothetical protein